MEDYESQYNEYKRSLLHSVSFRDKLREKYSNTMYSEENYINTNGVLDKIIALSGITGFCYALTLFLVQLDEFPGILIRIALAVIGTICFFMALHIGAEYKISSGKANFYSFQYEKCITSRVQWDKEMESKSIVTDFIHRHISREEFLEKYDNLSRYDRYLEDLINDFRFRDTVTDKL